MAASRSPARPVFRCALAALAVQCDDHVAARRALEELAASSFAILPRDNEWLQAAAFLTETARALRDTPRMASLYDELLPHSERSTANPPEGSLGSVERTLGILAAERGREDDAIGHLRRAIELDTAAGAIPWVVHAQVELADLVQAGEATALRNEAFDTASALGMEHVAVRLAGR